MGRTCMCCSQCLSRASVMLLVTPMAEWILAQRYTLCSMPEQVGTDGRDQQAYSPNGHVGDLEAISEIHYCGSRSGLIIKVG
jgi:hypothetical protein